MSKGISVSEKHGVNPTIPVCFFCGKEKNEIALLGKLPGDVEAPRNAVVDYKPCDECIEHFSKGVLVIEATQTPNDPKQPALRGAYPTGRYAVVKESAFRPEANLHAGREVFMPPDMFEECFGKK